MTPAEIERITADHRAALERLELTEKKHKQANKWILTAVLTAVATMGGSVAKHYLDIREKRKKIENTATVTAKVEARDDLRWEKLDEALNDIRSALSEVSTQTAVNEKAIEFLTRDQRWIMGAAEKRIEDRPRLIKRRPVQLQEIEPPDDLVNKKKGRILKQLAD